MKRYAVAAFLLFSVGLLAQGQTPKATQNPFPGFAEGAGQTPLADFKVNEYRRNPNPSVLFEMTPPRELCPVSMRARQLGSGGLMNAGRKVGVSAAAAAQRIHLMLMSGMTSSGIREARLTVHGTSPRGHAVRAQFTPDGFTDRAKKLHVVFDEATIQRLRLIFGCADLRR